MESDEGGCTLAGVSCTFFWPNVVGPNRLKLFVTFFLCDSLRPSRLCVKSLLGKRQSSVLFRGAKRQRPAEVSRRDAADSSLGIDSPEGYPTEGSADLSRGRRASRRGPSSRPSASRRRGRRW